MSSPSRSYVIGIGSQRAGTTLLHKILSDCTPVFMHPLKELHYFDTLFDTREFQLLHGNTRYRHGRRTIGRRAKASAARRMAARTGLLLTGRITKRRRAIAQERTLYHSLTVLAQVESVDELKSVPYADLYRPAIDDHAIVGEISPEYMLLPDEGITFMRDQCGPQTTIILLRRDPIDRILSSYVLLKAYRSTEPLGPLDVTEDEMWRELDNDGRWLQLQYALSDYEDAERRFSRRFPDVVTIDLESLIRGDSTVSRYLSDRIDAPVDAARYREIVATKANSFGDFAFSDELVRALRQGFDRAMSQRR